ncbi:MAG: ATP-binding cassette domain-containing protein, partial [Cellulosimicrobium funkei]
SGPTAARPASRAPTSCTTPRGCARPSRSRASTRRYEFQTGRENLVMMGELAHLPRRAVRPRAAALLERFDLIDAADRRVGTYSGGMRRRLDLAISLVADPAVLVLDEPTTGL